MGMNVLSLNAKMCFSDGCDVISLEEWKKAIISFIAGFMPYYHKQEEYLSDEKLF